MKDRGCCGMGNKQGELNNCSGILLHKPFPGAGTRRKNVGGAQQTNRIEETSESLRKPRWLEFVGQNTGKEKTP